MLKEPCKLPSIHPEDTSLFGKFFLHLARCERREGTGKVYRVEFKVVQESKCSLLGGEGAGCWGAGSPVEV